MDRFDAGFVAVMAPLSYRLDRRRHARIPAVLSAQADAVHAVRVALDTLVRIPGDAESLDAVEGHTRALLSALRNDDPKSLSERLMHLADWALRTDRTELMDAPGTPKGIRQLEMGMLDWQNRILGNYVQWSRLIREILRGARRPHLYDLAAGSGGFLRWVARSSAFEGVRLTSSDLSPEFVEMGRRTAEKEHLSIHFEVRDATNLRGLADPVDLFVVTQSAHHLSPGMLVRMIAQAVTLAPRGIWILDLMRSLPLLIAGIVVDTLTAPFPPFMLDGVLSFRRGYTPAELELLARVAGAAQVDARFKAPAYVLLHAQGSGPPPDR